MKGLEEIGLGVNNNNNYYFISHILSISIFTTAAAFIALTKLTNLRGCQLKLCSHHARGLDTIFP